MDIILDKKPKYCPICNNPALFLVNKSGVNYDQCNNCKTVFCDCLDQSDLVGGEHEIERNQKENHERIARVDEIIKGMKKDDVHILDIGCGTGYFIDDLLKSGYKNVDGYDPYTEKFWKLPKKEYYHVVTATEIFEHLCHPFTEIDLIYKSLVNLGAVLIETSFVDVALEENIPLEDFFYLNPDAGHSILYSHHSLDLLMATKGFIPREHYNRHVRLYQKIAR